MKAIFQAVLFTGIVILTMELTMAAMHAAADVLKVFVP